MILFAGYLTWKVYPTYEASMLGAMSAIGCLTGPAPSGSHLNDNSSQAHIVVPGTNRNRLNLHIGPELQIPKNWMFDSPAALCAGNEQSIGITSGSPVDQQGASTLRV
jgi:hypothetical protein